MAKKSGLGKGLDSLIPEKIIDTPGKTEIKNEPLMVKLGQVEPNREQPRKSFEEESLQELAESIRQFGVIQPLLVQKKADYYEIIAGERRWRAAKLAGLKEVPVIVKEYTSQEVMEISLIENIQRENLNPIEEAQAYQKLLKEFHLKQEDVAKRVSKSRTAITNTMRLLKLDERVQTMLIENELSSGHARALLSIEDTEKQNETAQKIVSEQLSVRETEALVREILQPDAKKEKKSQKTAKNGENDVIYQSVEDNLKTILGTKVSIRKKANNKGKIEIEYYSLEELERLIDLLQTAKQEA